MRTNPTYMHSPSEGLQRVLVMPLIEENRKIVAAVNLDPDAKPLTVAQLKSMVPLKAVRGHPKLANKEQLVSVRYSPEVLAYFRDTGEGWQARMDCVLRDYVATHGSRRTKRAA